MKIGQLIYNRNGWFVDHYSDGGAVFSSHFDKVARRNAGQGENGAHIDLDVLQGMVFYSKTFNDVQDSVGSPSGLAHGYAFSVRENCPEIFSEPERLLFGLPFFELPEQKDATSINSFIKSYQLDTIDSLPEREKVDPDAVLSECGSSREIFAKLVGCVYSFLRSKTDMTLCVCFPHAPENQEETVLRLMCCVYRCLPAVIRPKISFSCIDHGNAEKTLCFSADGQKTTRCWFELGTGEYSIAPVPMRCPDYITGLAKGLGTAKSKRALDMMNDMADKCGLQYSDSMEQCEKVLSAVASVCGSGNDLSSIIAMYDVSPDGKERLRTLETMLKEFFDSDETKEYTEDDCRRLIGMYDDTCDTSLRKTIRNTFISLFKEKNGDAAEIVSLYKQLEELNGGWLTELFREHKDNPTLIDTAICCAEAEEDLDGLYRLAERTKGCAKNQKYANAVRDRVKTLFSEKATESMLDCAEAILSGIGEKNTEPLRREFWKQVSPPYDDAARLARMLGRYRCEAPEYKACKEITAIADGLFRDEDSYADRWRRMSGEKYDKLKKYIHSKIEAKSEKSFTDYYLLSCDPGRENITSVLKAIDRCDGIAGFFSVPGNYKYSVFWNTEAFSRRNKDVYTDWVEQNCGKKAAKVFKNALGGGYAAHTKEYGNDEEYGEEGQGFMGPVISLTLILAACGCALLTYGSAISGAVLLVLGGLVCIAGMVKQTVDYDTGLKDILGYVAVFFVIAALVYTQLTMPDIPIVAAVAGLTALAALIATGRGNA